MLWLITVDGGRVFSLGCFFLVEFSLCSTVPLPVCPENETTYALTQCDQNNGAWRVAVPYNDSFRCIPSAGPPLRIAPCVMSCPAGYLYSLEALKCTECPAGTYSVGNAQYYEDWSSLPNGFVTKTAPITESGRTTDPDKIPACLKQAWKPLGDFVALEEGEGCISKLSLEIDLVDDGHIEFEYQFPESNLMFVFSTVRSECEENGSAATRNRKTFPEQTGRNTWAVSKTKLQMGKQTLVWLGVSMASGNQENLYKPIRMRSVRIEGVKYTEVCTPCPAGTYNSAGSSRCQDCPKDFISSKGDAKCTPCQEDQYSLPGFTECFERPWCSPVDYMKILGACDHDNLMEVRYAWIEPKICRNEPAIDLPSAVKINCPSCPSGMVRYNSSNCGTCSSDQFLDSEGKCRACAGSGLLPAYSYQLNSWNYFPYGISTLCWSISGAGCANDAGWQLGNDSIISGYGHEDDALLVLQLVTEGFRNMGTDGVYGRLSFEIEIRCQNPGCQLDFLVEDTETVERANSWTGPQQRQRFEFSFRKNNSIALSWIFVKTSTPTGGPLTKPRKFSHDTVKIFSITLTNTLDGGASTCEACAGSSSAGNCSPCTPSQLWNPTAKRCDSCPPNSIISSATGLCTQCPENLTPSLSKKFCISNCRVSIQGGKKAYDLSPLKGYHQSSTQHFFQVTGESYFHQFNLSFCEETPAVCKNTAFRVTSSARNTATGLVCRLTNLISVGSSNTTTAVQSFVTGQELVGISDNPEYATVKATNGFDQLKPEFPAHLTPDLHYFFRSTASSGSCVSGRSTVLTMRCSKTTSSLHDIRLPTQCPDGTCDGCSYHLLWLTAYACPICGPGDYSVVRGECSGGHQSIYYHSNAYCQETNSTTNLIKRVKCAAVPFSVQILLIVLTCFGVILTVSVVILYKSAKKYEYRYMKLVQDATGTIHLQLPESCVDEPDIDATREEEEGDEGADHSGRNFNVQFRTPSETVYTKVKKAIIKRKDMRKPAHSASFREENHLLAD